MPGRRFAPSSPRAPEADGRLTGLITVKDLLAAGAGNRPGARGRSAGASPRRPGGMC